MSVLDLRKKSSPPEPPVVAHVEPQPSPSATAPCPGEKFVAVMKDHNMSGIIENGQSFSVLPNWYACHPLQDGDYVYYRYSYHRDPVVRIVRAREGDHFELIPDTVHKSWNIKINGKILLSDKDPYYFGGELKPPLGLYEKSHKGLLAQSEAIVFSSRAPGNLDSGIFGLVNVIDLIGKVELLK